MAQISYVYEPSMLYEFVYQVCMNLLHVISMLYEFGISLQHEKCSKWISYLHANSWIFSLFLAILINFLKSKTDL
jgi:hypothetical protein